MMFFYRIYFLQLCINVEQKFLLSTNKLAVSSLVERTVIGCEESHMHFTLSKNYHLSGVA